MSIRIRPLIVLNEPTIATSYYAPLGHASLVIDEPEFRKDKNGPGLKKFPASLRRSEFASEPASRFDRHERIRPVALLAP